MMEGDTQVYETINLQTYGISLISDDSEAKKIGVVRW